MKGRWWMPWRQAAMKDVGTCDKPRGAGTELRSWDFRMGQPGVSWQHGPSSAHECIVCRSERGELKHLSTRRKIEKPRFRKEGRGKADKPKPSFGMGLWAPISESSRSRIAWKSEPEKVTVL